MVKLVHGRSYLWLFPIFLILFFGGFGLGAMAGDMRWGALMMPAFVAFLLSCELRSGVAFDSWWRASYLKGSRQYQAMVIWHAIGIVLFCVFAYFFITLR
jgi:hypothetical protein